MTEVITSMNYKWKLMAFGSLAIFMLIFTVINERTNNPLLLQGVTIIGILVPAYIYYAGPRREKEGLSLLRMPLPRLSKFFGETIQTFSFRTDEYKIVQNDGSTTRFYLLEGPPIGENQMGSLIKFVSSAGRTVVLIELPTRTSKTVGDHAQCLEKRILESDNQEQRIALANSSKGKLKEFNDPSMVALMAVTTKGEHEPLVAFENIKFVLIPPEEYLRFFEGEVTTNAFKYSLADNYPVLNDRIIKVFTGTEYVSTSNISHIFGICRLQGAGVQFVTKQYDQETALDILAGERERISIRLQKLQLQTEKDHVSGKNSQLEKDENDRLALVTAMEEIIKEGNDSLYAVIPRLFCAANNLKALENRGDQLIKEIKIKGLTFSEPLEQRVYFEKMLSCKDVGKEHNLSILESDLAEMLQPLFRVSQQCNNPKGIIFGRTKYDEPVIVDITDLPSKGMGGVIAKTGIGKSFFLALLSHEMFLKIWNVFIMNPKGKLEGDFEYKALVEYVGGVALKIQSINIFDMFVEDRKLQLAFEKECLTILCKGIDNDHIKIIIEKAEEIRKSEKTPNFDLLFEQFKKEASSESFTNTQSMIASLGAKEYTSRVPIGQILKHIGSLAGNPAFSETPDCLKHLPSVIEVDYSAVNGFEKSALINLTLEMLCLMKGKPTLIIGDEMHRIVREDPNIGRPNSSDLVSYLSTEGRAANKIPVFAAQSLKFFAPENTVTNAEKAANVAVEQVSWLLLMGKQQRETLVRLGLLAYEKYFEDEEIGKGLLVITGYPQPIEVNITVPAYLHEIFTGKKKPLQLNQKEDLSDVIRIHKLSGPVVKYLIEKKGYLRLDHKELNGANQIFLVPWANDLRRMEDICLCKEFFEKQRLEIEVDWEIGTIDLPGGMLFIQSYEYPHELVSLINWLDKKSKNWFVVCHEQYSEIKDSLNAKRFVMRNEVQKLKFAK
jgi:hypothetical protein